MASIQPDSNFNPPPSYEGRRFSPSPSNSDPKFQSTPLMRGETLAEVTNKVMSKFQSTPLIRGETPPGRAEYPAAVFQSTPLIRGETKRHSVHNRRIEFQSTPLMRGETLRRHLLVGRRVISIRSPLTRGDCFIWRCESSRSYFNPLPSHEGRQYKPPKIHPDLRQLTQQNHDTPLFGALQAPFCGAKPDIRGAKPMEKP